MNQLNLINQCFEKKILLNKDLLKLDTFEIVLDKLNDSNKFKIFSDLLILNKDNIFLLENFLGLDDLLKFDRYKVNFEKNKDSEIYNSFLNELKQKSIPKQILKCHLFHHKSENQAGAGMVSR